MPYIYTTVDVDVDIGIDEFLESCNEREIKELIKALVEDGHLKPSVSTYQDTSKMTANEIEFHDKMDVLATKYYSMSNEDTEILGKLYEKYC